MSAPSSSSSPAAAAAPVRGGLPDWDALFKSWNKLLESGLDPLAVARGVDAELKSKLELETYRQRAADAAELKRKPLIETYRELRAAEERPDRQPTVDQRRMLAALRALMARTPLHVWSETNVAEWFRTSYPTASVADRLVVWQALQPDLAEQQRRHALRQRHALLPPDELRRIGDLVLERLALWEQEQPVGEVSSVVAAEWMRQTYDKIPQEIITYVVDKRTLSAEAKQGDALLTLLRQWELQQKLAAARAVPVQTPPRPLSADGIVDWLRMYALRAGKRLSKRVVDYVLWHRGIKQDRWPAGLK